MAQILANKVDEHSYVFCFKGSRVGVTKHPYIYLLDGETGESTPVFVEPDLDEAELSKDGYLGDHTEEIDYELFVAMNRQHPDEDDDDDFLAADGHEFLRFDADDVEDDEEDD